MKEDPPVRADGRCARRGCRKPLTRPGKNAAGLYADIRFWDLEPFCSRPCSELYHGTQAPARDTGNRGGGRKRKLAV